MGCHRPGTYMHECAIKYHFINEYYVVKDGEETSRRETHIPGIYSLGEPADITQYSWYHGNMSKEEAEIIVLRGSFNRFLVRQLSPSPQIQP